MTLTLLRTWRAFLGLVDVECFHFDDWDLYTQDSSSVIMVFVKMGSLFTSMYFTLISVIFGYLFLLYAIVPHPNPKILWVHLNSVERIKIRLKDLKTCRHRPRRTFLSTCTLCNITGLRYHRRFVQCRSWRHPCNLKSFTK